MKTHASFLQMIASEANVAGIRPTAKWYGLTEEEVRKCVEQFAKSDPVQISPMQRLAATIKWTLLS